MRTDALGFPIQVGTFSASAPATVSLSVSSNNVQLVPGKLYRIWASVDCSIAFGSGSVVATTSSHPISAKIPELHITDNTNFYLAGIVSTGTGTLFASLYDV